MTLPIHVAMTLPGFICHVSSGKLPSAKKGHGNDEGPVTDVVWSRCRVILSDRPLASVCFRMTKSIASSLSRNIFSWAASQPCPDFMNIVANAR